MPKRPAKPAPQAPAPPQTVEVVDPRWILKALGFTLLIALCCAWVTLCVLFWQGQWQLVLHPSSTLTRDPAALSLPFQPVRFGVDATGAPQLSGWWIPSESPSDPTALVLHGLSGNMSNTLDRLQLLHAARLNVLVFDYRGFGSSGGPHPNQERVEADSRSALDYLTGIRGISPDSIVLYGEGAGAPVAVKLAATHPQLPALVLFDPIGDLTHIAASDPRSRLIPVSLLFRERFPLAGPLRTLSTPKLIITQAAPPDALNPSAIADPKMLVDLRRPAPGEPFHSLLRFFDSYLKRPLATPLPTPKRS